MATFLIKSINTYVEEHSVEAESLDEAMAAFKAGKAFIEDQQQTDEQIIDICDCDCDYTIHFQEISCEK